MLALWLMTALGQNRKCPRLRCMSVLPSRADIVRPLRHVRFVPGTDIRQFAYADDIFSEQTRRVLLLRGDAMIASLLNGTKPVRAETLSGEAPEFSGLAAIVASSPSRPAKRWRVIEIQHSLGRRQAAA
jgi:hypothetical protein